MSLAVFSVILFAAALHACWNAMVKGAGDKLLMTALIAVTASLLAALVLPFMPQPSSQSWPFILASVAIQVLYFLVLARIYSITDMSQSYALMRGTAPLFVVCASVFLIGDPLSLSMWAGILVICTGVLCMAAGAWRSNIQGLALAFLNALIVASYTLVDGIGVRCSDAPVSYTLWVFLLTGLPFVFWILLRKRRQLGGFLRQYWHFGLIGGAGSMASYGLALWAMTIAPVAVVSALRETSILFGVLIAILFLGEKVRPLRITAACIIAAGAMILRLS